MLAIDVMTPSVICAQPEMTIHEAAQRLVDNRISGMPVVDATGALVGMVSEGDLLHRVETGTESRRSRWLELFSSTRDLAGTFVKEHGRVVADVMTSSVISVEEQTPVADIAEVMEKAGIKRVPVVRAGQIVGIVSRANLIRALASVPVAAPAGESVSDREIAEAIVAALRDKRWALAKENVIVKDGVAHLWGVIESDEERRAIRIAAEGVPGVKRVESHLEFPSVIPTL